MEKHCVPPKKSQAKTRRKKGGKKTRAPQSAVRVFFISPGKPSGFQLSIVLSEET